ncbi:hypothetical protein V5F89_12490 [Pelagerythrobacter marensis]|uniref:Phage tail protein n=1 Tax=Pelagerythrobacter marensis TaxID=543877 RepID=A0ABZ2D1Y8_9SPHN
MDAATIEALGQEVVYVQWFAWIDIEGDPVRAVSGVQDIAIGAGETGDPDLDGHVFEAVPSELTDISDVQHSEDGSETVTARLSGLPLVNSDLLDVVGQKSKWRKREARLWFRVLEPATFGAGGQPVTFTPLPIHSYYSGYLVGLTVNVGEDDQTIVAAIENYQAALSEGSGLTYLHQSEFDAGDKSAEQTLAASNGIQKAGVRGGAGGGGGGRGGGGIWSRQVHK